MVLGLVRPDEYLVRMEDLDRLAARNVEQEEAHRLAEMEREEEGGELVRYAALPLELLQ